MSSSRHSRRDLQAVACSPAGGVAGPGEKRRLRPSFLLSRHMLTKSLLPHFLLLWAALVGGGAFAQDRIYRCGNEYTNIPTRAQEKSCTLKENHGAFMGMWLFRGVCVRDRTTRRGGPKSDKRPCRLWRPACQFLSPHRRVRAGVHPAAPRALRCH